LLTRSPNFSVTFQSLLDGRLALVLIALGFVGAGLVGIDAGPVAAADHDHSSELPYEKTAIWGKNLEDLRVLPDGDQRIERELYRQGEYFRRWHAIHDLIGPGHISRKGQALLEKRGLGPSLLKSDAPPAVGATASEPDILKVLLVRVSFETNRNDHLTTIPEDGDFMLEAPAEPGPLDIDPPPHNRAYFQAHLRGLSEYYKFQSGGRLIIEGDVLPLEENGSYKLGDIADYGPNNDGSWVDGHLDDLERLVRDMIAVTDSTTQANGTVNLADYDDDNDFAYVIFVHSGSDWQSDINGDSPNDIPTFFMTLGEAVSLTGVDSETGALGSLTEVSVIPETTTQDGYPGSIAAGLYHEFGHALGLVDVYNTAYGTPNAGIWDLMDSGTNLPVTLGDISDTGDTTIVTAVGVLPPSLGAWNKWFLGWLEMGETDGRDDSYYLPAVWVPRDQYWMYNRIAGRFDTSYPQALKAGVSSREFFLLENRWVPELPRADHFDGYNSLPYDDLYLVRDGPTRVILYLAGLRSDDEMNSGIYDYFLPPGGLLVWHVNMDRIQAGLRDNTINVYGDGLRLVEADGIQDIGVLDAYVLGWYGTANDPFSKDSGFKNLYMDGVPSSRCFDRSWSGLSLSDIRESSLRNGSIMRFEANIHSDIVGFPWEIAPVETEEAVATDGLAGPRGIDVASVIPVPVGLETFLVFSDAAPDTLSGELQPGYDEFPAALYALRGNGTAPWPQLADRPAGAFLQLDAPLAGPVAAYEDDLAEQHLVLGTRAGTVQSLLVRRAEAPQSDWSVSVGDSLMYGPVPLYAPTSQTRWLCVPEPGSLLLLDQDGQELGAPIDVSALDLEPGSAGYPAVVVAPRVLVLPPAVDDEDPPLRSDLAAVVTETGWVLVRQELAGFSADPAVFPFAGSPLEGPVHTAVVPGPYSVQFHIFDARGDVGAWEIDHYGTVLELEDRLDVDASLVTEPAVADVDGDGRHDLVLATDQRILAFSPTGSVAAGFPARLYDLFPLPDTTRIVGPLVVVDANGNGANEVFFNTDGGHLIGLSPGGKLLEMTPYRWGDFGLPGLAVGGGPSIVEDERVLWLVSPGGYTGPPFDRQFVNGRIMAYDLGLPADAADRTSEWLGLGGGSLRNGPVGAAQDIEIAGLAEADESNVFFYPNPLHDDMVTIRFFGEASGEAGFYLYTLEGEEIVRSTFPVDGGVINEHREDLAGVVSGMYLGRLVYPTESGYETKTLTLAVER
jgi:M6 family metalloprotease-like protein